MSNLLVDVRWKGDHGIGRYAREVIPRLKLPFERIDGGDPASLSQIFRPVRIRKDNGDTIIYSPGFVGFATSARQILTIHDLIHLQVPGRKMYEYQLYYKMFVSRIISRSAVVFTVSETSKDAISKWNRNDRVEIINTGNGCSNAFTSDVQPHSEGRPYILYVGNFKAHKNAAVIFEAIQRVPELQLIVVTSDRDSAAMHAKKSEVDNRVTVLSHLSDERLAELYKGARWTVIPSIVEGFGLPAAESLCVGTPVVYWRGCQSVSEIVGNRGITVDSKSNSSEWAEAISETPITVADSQSLREKYDWNLVSERINNALSALK